MKLDLHIHSKYSFDSLLEPKRIVKIALSKGINAIAVTDHNTIKGALKTRFYQNKCLIVIMGSEIKTNIGDIIGLFLTEEIISRDFFDVVDEIKDQDGIVVLPHPYRKREAISREISNNVELIEILNARSSKKQNTEAKELAKRSGKIGIAGSDAHLSFEIGRVQTIASESIENEEDLRKALLHSELEVFGVESPYIVHAFSVAIEKAKKKEFFELFKVYGREIKRRI